MQLTDHLSGELVYSTTAYQTGDEIGTNATFAAAQMAEWVAGDPNSLYNSPNDAIAYINLTSLFGAGPAATLLSEIKANQTTLVAAYSTNSLVQAGYNATYTAEVDDIYTSPVGQAEILMANTGSYNAFPTAGNTISIQAAIQHPLSRGSVKITSKSTFISPTIDPGYFTHPADIQILREAFKYARIAGQTQPLAALLTTELSPGPSVSTDAEWETWIRSAVSTEYHPAGTCSMLPEALGGVIDEELRVYGTLNLRIVDSSIVPISMSAHMTAPLYGISENAYNIIIPSGTTTTTSTTTSSTSTSSSTSKAKASSTTTSSSPSSSSSGTSSQNKPSAAVGSLQVGVIASVLAMGLACVGIW
jgi:choline dehydrogenase